MLNLQYSNLSRETIKKFHREYGGLSVDLSSARGNCCAQCLIDGICAEGSRICRWRSVVLTRNGMCRNGGSPSDKK